MAQSTACLDWERRIVARESLIAFAPAYPDLAAEAWEIIGGFRLVDVIGQPLIRDAALPWLRELVEAIFGSEGPDGRRIINEFFLMVSKKNAKSTIAAAIMLCALIMNWRASAELMILSPTKEIADNSYLPIRDMIKADPELQALLKVQDHFRKITHMGTSATLKVVAADSDAVSGKKASFVFVDELHEFGKQVKASNMLLEATGGLTSRPEGFVIYATTQSAEPPAGVFKDKLEYARKVRDGKVSDPRFLAVIYEFPAAMIEAGAHRDLNNAYVTNPNWGKSVDIERITQLHTQAREGDEGKFKEFLAKHLNVEIGLNLRSDRWAGADFWQQQSIKTFTLEELIERCDVIDAGIDGGGLDDLLGLAVLGRCKTTRQWLAWIRAWAHPSVMERRKQEAARFTDFARDGDLILVERIGDDVHEVAYLMSQLEASGKLDRIGIDPAGMGGILDAMLAADVPEEKIIGIKQGWSLTGSIKTTERKLAEGVIVHPGQALMAWCVSNAKVELRGNNIVITKQAAGSAKIDPLLALFNAVSLMALNPMSEGSIDDFIYNPIST
jgi:phage terminase large subunit-like protein